jgi:hypothetical protein
MMMFFEAYNDDDNNIMLSCLYHKNHNKHDATCSEEPTHSMKSNESDSESSQSKVILSK